MKKIYLIALLLYCAVTVSGQTWQYVNSMGKDYAMDNVVDAQNNHYVAAGGTGGAHLGSFQADGTTNWIVSLSSTGSNGLFSVDLDYSGDYLYACGDVNDSLFLGKFSRSSGALIWKRTAAYSNTAAYFELTVDNQNNVYVTGNIRDSIYYGLPASGSFGASSAQCLLLTAYNSSGTRLWTHATNAAVDGWGIDWDGGLFVCGDANSSGFLVAEVSTASGNLGNTQYGGISTFGMAKAFDIKLDGNWAYLTGTFHDSLTLDTLMHTYGEGGFVTRIDKNLSAFDWNDYWAKPWSATRGTTIDFDPCGKMIISSLVDDGPNATGALLRYTKDGEYLGSFDFDGGAPFVELMSVAVDNDGQFNLVGAHRDTMVLAGDTTVGSFVLGLTACFDEAYAWTEATQTSISSDPFTLYGYPSGGGFGGPGVIGNQFDPYLSGEGVWDVTYTVGDPCCAKVVILQIEVGCYPDEPSDTWFQTFDAYYKRAPHFMRYEGDFYSHADTNPETGNPVYSQRMVTPAIYDDGNDDAFWGQLTDKGLVLSSNQLQGSLEDRGMCIKKVSGGFLLSGTTRSLGTNLKKPFMAKFDMDRQLLWLRYYEFGQHVIVTNHTELSNGDLALIGTYNPWEISGQQHGFFVMVTTSDGNTILSESQYSHPNRQWQVIDDVEPHSDGGFLVVGSNGHNNDYHAGLLMRFDMNYNLMWGQEFLRPLPGGTYDLGGPASQRSNTFLNGVRELPDGRIAVVGRTSDHTAGGGGGTFFDGLLFLTDPMGSYMGGTRYQGRSGERNWLYDLEVLPDTSLIAVGRTRNSAQVERTLLLRIDPVSNLLWSRIYGDGARNVGHTVGVNDDGGFSVLGVTGRLGSEVKPFAFRVDSTGDVGDYCQESLGLDQLPLDLIPLPWSMIETSLGVSAFTDSLDEYQPCLLIRSCDVNQFSRQPESQVSSESIEADGYRVWPNPASGSFYLHTDQSFAFTLIDMQGRVLKSGSNGAGQQQQISVSGLASGMYVLRLQGENQNQSLRIWIR